MGETAPNDLGSKIKVLPPVPMTLRDRAEGVISIGLKRTNEFFASEESYREGAKSYWQREAIMWEVDNSRREIERDVEFLEDVNKYKGQIRILGVNPNETDWTPRNLKGRDSKSIEDIVESKLTDLQTATAILRDQVTLSQVDWATGGIKSSGLAAKFEAAAKNIFGVRFDSEGRSFRFEINALSSLPVESAISFLNLRALQRGEFAGLIKNAPNILESAIDVGAPTHLIRTWALQLEHGISVDTINDLLTEWKAKHDFGSAESLVRVLADEKPDVFEIKILPSLSLTAADTAKKNEDTPTEALFAQHL